MPKYLALYSASSEPMPEMTPKRAGDDGGLVRLARWCGCRDRRFRAPTVPASDGAGSVGGYSIVQADNVDALDAIFESNPHRRKGGTVEFHEILDIG